MKRNWTEAEMARHFSLSFDEFDLLANKSGSTRLGFAVLLKFFQLEGRFPNAKNEVPRSLVNYLAPQVEVEAEAYLQYDWLGRSIKYHRTQIRQFLGFRPASLEDQAQMTRWLSEKVVREEQRPEILKVEAYQHWREAKIEPPTPEQLERLVRSVLHTYEESCFTAIYQKLSQDTCQQLENLLNVEDAPQAEGEEETAPESPVEREAGDGETQQVAPDPAAKAGQKKTATVQPTATPLSFQQLKQAPAGTTLKAVLKEITRLEQLRQVKLPPNLFAELTPRQVAAFRSRANAESSTELRRHPPARRYTLLAAFCQLRGQEIADNLVESLVQVIHRIGAKAERRLDREIIAEYKRVDGKPNLLYQLAEVSLAHPDESVRQVVYPVVNEQTLREVVVEHQYSGKNYRQKVYTVMRGSYGYHYRRMVSALLNTLQFRSNNTLHKPVIKALELLRQYADAASTQKYYPANETVPLEGVVKGNWLELVVDPTKRGRRKRVNRIYYEMAVLESLREKLRSKEIWVVGAHRFGDPDRDLPTDFEVKRLQYYQALNQPTEADHFIELLKKKMQDSLTRLDHQIPTNPHVKLLEKNNGHIQLSPLEGKAESLPVDRLKQEVGRRWPMTSLLEILKETALRTNFTRHFHSVTEREHLPPEVLQKRLLLCLYGLGTNSGLKRVSASEEYQDLLYVKQRYLQKETLQNAIAEVANAIFKIRQPQIWGEATTTCASDSTHFGAYDQNLLTEWHVRYGGRGVYVTWNKTLCYNSANKLPSLYWY